MSFDNQSGQQSPQKKQKPLLTNNQDGAAAWLNQDKNGDTYVSVKLPLGLGTLNLFGRDELERDALNLLREHVEKERGSGGGE